MNAQPPLSTEALIERVDRAREQRRLSDGVITRVQAPHPREPSWHIVATARADILNTLNEQRTRLHLTSEVFGRDDRVSFWVIAIQADQIEHRCVVPLVGPTLRECIAQGSLSSVVITSRSAPDASPVLSVPLALSPGTFAELNLRHRQRFEPLKVISEQAAAIAQLLAPDFITRPAYQPQPGSISVCSILPPELEAALADMEANFRRTSVASQTRKAGG